MIQITVDTRRAVVTNKETLTVGSAGIGVEFTLSEDWAGLAKVAVFRMGDDGEKVDVVLDSSLTCVVPPEVLTTEDEVVFCGVYGKNAQGTVIIPTIWASLGVVKPGALPGTPADAQPTPSIWAQILDVAQDAEATADAAMSAVEAGLQDLSTLEGTVQQAENARASAEETRASAEQNRASAETNRQTAEEGRASAETERVTAEQNRVSAEEARAAAEVAREWERNNFLRDGVNVTTLEAGAAATVTRTTITDPATQASTTGSMTFGIPRGEQGDPGTPGTPGAPGSPGPGVASGGTAGQVLKKLSGTDYDTGWGDLNAGEIGFDGQETYAAGSVGAALQNQTRQISDKITSPTSPASGAFLVWNGSAWVAQTLATWQGGNY